MSQDNNSQPDFSATCSSHPITVEIRKSNDCPVLIRFGGGVLAFSITEQQAYDMADFLLHRGKGSYHHFEVGQDRYEIIWNYAIAVFERIGSNYPYQLTESMAKELSETINCALSKFASLSVTFEDSLETAKKKTHENLRSVFGQ